MKQIRLLKILKSITSNTLNFLPSTLTNLSTRTFSIKSKIKHNSPLIKPDSSSIPIQNTSNNSSSSIPSTKPNLYTQIFGKGTNNAPKTRDLTSHIVVNQHKQVLIYYSILPLSNFIKFHFSRAALVLGLISFIKSNPLYLIFPAAMPIAGFSLALSMFMYIYDLRKRKLIASEIWYDFENQELIVKMRSSMRKLLKNQVIIIPIDSIDLRGRENDLFSFPSNLKFSNTNLYDYWNVWYSIDKKKFLLYKYPIYQRFFDLSDLLEKIILKVDFSRSVIVKNTKEFDEFFRVENENLKTISEKDIDEKNNEVKPDATIADDSIKDIKNESTSKLAKNPKRNSPQPHKLLYLVNTDEIKNIDFAENLLKLSKIKNNN